MFHIAKNVEPILFTRTKWDMDHFSLGSYSFIPIGGSANDRKIFSKGTDGSQIYDTGSIGTICFAGEHTSESYPATVQGAYISGLRAVQFILNGNIPSTHPNAHGTNIDCIGSEYLPGNKKSNKGNKGGNNNNNNKNNNGSSGNNGNHQPQHDDDEEASSSNNIGGRHFSKNKQRAKNNGNNRKQRKNNGNNNDDSSSSSSSSSSESD